MTREEKLVKLARINNDPRDDEDVLGFYLDMAGDKILNKMYPFRKDYTGLTIPERYDNIQLNISIYLLGKRGAEGEVQHIENGIHRNWGAADVPDTMLKDVMPFAEVIL